MFLESMATHIGRICLKISQNYPKKDKKVAQWFKITKKSKIKKIVCRLLGKRSKISNLPTNFYGENPV